MALAERLLERSKLLTRWLIVVVLRVVSQAGLRQFNRRLALRLLGKLLLDMHLHFLQIVMALLRTATIVDGGQALASECERRRGHLEEWVVSSHLLDVVRKFALPLLLSLALL